MIRVIIRRWGRFEGISKDREKGPKPWSNQVALPLRKLPRGNPSGACYGLREKKKLPFARGRKCGKIMSKHFLGVSSRQEILVEEVSFTPNGKIGEWVSLPPPSSASLGLAQNVKKRGVRSDKIIFRRYCTVCTAQGLSDPAANGRPMRNL